MHESRSRDRAVWLAAVLAAGLSVAPIARASAEGSGRDAYAGRSLSEALSLLQERGLRVIFSSGLVRPEMRVDQEPRFRNPRDVLEELLAPHGLAAQKGPGGGLLIVRARARGAGAERSDPKPAAARPGQDQDPARFRETVEVKDESPKDGALGSAVDVRPLDVMAVAGAAENVYRAIQMLPGVSGLNEIEGRVAVRGGGPDQNLTVMDGIEVHNPYRLFGITSAFNPETIEKFELVTGAFHPRYGDRLSSILVVDTRSGRREKGFSGSSALSITDANVILEGRLPGPASGSWLLTGRRTYYDLVLGSGAEDADLPSFADLQLKAAWEPGAGRKLSLFALRNRESGAVERGREDEFRTSARNEVVSLRFSTPVGKAVSHTVASWYENRDRIGFRDESRPSATRSSDVIWFELLTARDFRIRDLSLRQEVAYQPSARHLLGSGFDAHWMQTAVAWRLSAVDPDDFGRQGPWTRPDGAGSLAGPAFPSRFRGGLWLHDRFQASPRLTLEAGLRLDRGGITPRTTVSPRASARFRLDGATVLGAAFGVHTQSTGFEKFLQREYFFDGSSMFDLTALSSSGLRNERALHLVTSAERRLGRALDLRLEAFYKRFDDLVVGRLETEAERQARLGRYDFPEELRGNLPTEPLLTRVPTNDGRGRAYGVELLLSRRPASPEARFSGWLSYTLAAAERQAYGVTYPFDYDRRHSASVVTLYRPSRTFELSAALKLASSFPWRLPVGLRVQAVADRTDRDGDGNRTELVPRQGRWFLDDSHHYNYETYFGGPQNSRRVRGPGYSRVDMRASFHPQWWGGRWTLYLDMINVLGRHNYNVPDWQQEGDPDRGEPVTFTPGPSEGSGLPRIPSLGIRVAF